MSLFSDLTVLSLEQATTLPFLTQRLAREGARVIRLEPPGRGDPNRYVGKNLLDEDGLGRYFLANNRGPPPARRVPRPAPGAGVGACPEVCSTRIDISMFRSAVNWMASPLMLAALG